MGHGQKRLGTIAIELFETAFPAQPVVKTEKEHNVEKAGQKPRRAENFPVSLLLKTACCFRGFGSQPEMETTVLLSCVTRANLHEAYGTRTSLIVVGM